MALKVCKECQKEVSSSAKKCPSCGKDQRNWFMRHKILSVIGVLIIFGIIGASTGKDEPQSTTSQPSAEEVKTNTSSTSDNISKEKAEPETTKYSTGTYLVGKDIKSGLYKVTLTDTISKMGYVERAKDVNMELDSIIANILLTGNGYVEILDTDTAVRLQGVEIEPIQLDKLNPAIKEEASDGIYLVGYDLAPGTYKVEVTDTTTNMGYVERAKSVAMGMDDIIANQLIQGPGYVKIEEGDFAVRLQGVKITFQE